MIILAFIWTVKRNENERRKTSLFAGPGHENNVLKCDTIHALQAHSWKRFSASSFISILPANDDVLLQI